MQVLWTCLLSILSLYNNVIRTFSLSYLFPSSFVVLLYPWAAYDNAARRPSSERARERTKREKEREKGRRTTRVLSNTM